MLGSYGICGAPSPALNAADVYAQVRAQPAPALHVQVSWCTGSLVHTVCSRWTHFRHDEIPLHVGSLKTCVLTWFRGSPLQARPATQSQRTQNWKPWLRISNTKAQNEAEKTHWEWEVTSPPHLTWWAVGFRETWVPAQGLCLFFEWNQRTFTLHPKYYMWQSPGFSHPCEMMRKDLTKSWLWTGYRVTTQHLRLDLTSFRSLHQ